MEFPRLAALFPQDFHCSEKGGNLHPGKENIVNFLAVCRAQVGIHAENPQAGQGKQGGQGVDVLCPLSQAAHAGVDLQMYFYRIGSGGVQSSCVGAVGRSLNQVVGGEKAGVLRGCIAHNQNFTLDAGLSKRDAFLKSSYGKGTHADPVQVRGNRQSSVAVSVGFYDCHKSAVFRKMLFQLLHVPFQVFIVQLLPGPLLGHEPENHGVRTDFRNHFIPSS